MLAGALVAAGFALCGFSLAQLETRHPQLAQATSPLQSSPSPAPQETRPPSQSPVARARLRPRPSPPAPMRKAKKEGAKPALPPAPAEKMAPPIQQK